jgi:hypothetical protein
MRLGNKHGSRGNAVSLANDLPARREFVDDHLSEGDIS